MLFQHTLSLSFRWLKLKIVKYAELCSDGSVRIPSPIQLQCLQKYFLLWIFTTRKNSVWINSEYFRSDFSTILPPKKIYDGLLFLDYDQGFYPFIFSTFEKFVLYCKIVAVTRVKHCSWIWVTYYECRGYPLQVFSQVYEYNMGSFGEWNSNWFYCR